MKQINQKCRRDGVLLTDGFSLRRKSSALRHCERSEAIQYDTNKVSWGLTEINKE